MKVYDDGILEKVKLDVVCDADPRGDLVVC